MQPHSIPERPVGPGPHFTLIEMLLVLGILGVLVSVLVPVLADATHRAEESRCSDNLRLIGVAMGTYADSADGEYPYTLGQMTTETGARQMVLTSRSSMGAFIELLDGERERLSCPTLWQGIAPDHRGPLPAPYSRGGAITWGYNKWGGTLNTKPLTARQGYYSRYQDIGATTELTGAGTTNPGYLSVTRVGNAMRQHLVMGNSLAGGLIWQSAYRPKSIVPLMGLGPIPPSEVVLFSDSNNLGKTAITTSHSLVRQSTAMIVAPPVVEGVNELKADGHVTWYDMMSGSLYYVTDGEPGGAGVFVQDNR